MLTPSLIDGVSYSVYYMADNKKEPKRLLVIFNEGISEERADFQAAVIMTGLEYDDVDVLLVDNDTFDRLEQPPGSVKVKVAPGAP